MSLPSSMKTGNGNFIYENVYPETFYVVYLILGAILRRCSYKDSDVYIEHNSEILEQELLDTGVIFNLFSEYGVGKQLKPLIKELFSTLTLNPTINKNNIFFQEIVRLAGDASKVIREHNPNSESSWVTQYATENTNSLDTIAVNRSVRLYPLFLPSKEKTPKDNEGPEDNETNNKPNNQTNQPNNDNDGPEDREQSSDSDNSDGPEDSDTDNSSSEDSGPEDSEENCHCQFCREFRNYHYPHNRNVNEIITNVLTVIAKESIPIKFN